MLLAVPGGFGTWLCTEEDVFLLIRLVKISVILKEVVMVQTKGMYVYLYSKYKTSKQIYETGKKIYQTLFAPGTWFVRVRDVIV